jgi:hypothetical protein
MLLNGFEVMVAWKNKLSLFLPSSENTLVQTSLFANTNDCNNQHCDGEEDHQWSLRFFIHQRLGDKVTEILYSHFYTFVSIFYT